MPASEAVAANQEDINIGICRRSEGIGHLDRYAVFLQLRSGGGCSHASALAGRSRGRADPVQGWRCPRVVNCCDCILLILLRCEPAKPFGAGTVVRYGA